MNDRQRNVLIWGVVAAVVAGLYLPWNYTVDAPYGHSRKPAGYNFILDPPAPEEKNNPAYGVAVDAHRLLIEWGVIALVVAGVLLNLQRPDGEHRDLPSEHVDDTPFGECPKCGQPLQERFKSFECANEDCDFVIWKILAGRPFTRAEIETLAKERKIGPLAGFLSKDNQRFDAKVRLNAEFKLEFDLEATPAGKVALLKRASTNGKPKVMVTDDAPACLESLKSVIESWGYEVVTFTDKADAIKRFGEIKPDVVTTDLMSPGLGGLDFIRLVRELDPSIPVIIISGYETLEAAREAVRLGVLEYFNKPFDVTALRQTIEQALRDR